MLFDEPTSGLDPITARTVDAEIIKPARPGARHLPAGHAQLRDAFYVATHEARRQNSRISMVPASPATREAVEFIMLKDGRIYFSRDPPPTFAPRPITYLQYVPVRMGTAPRGIGKATPNFRRRRCLVLLRAPGSVRQFPRGAALCAGLIGYRAYRLAGPGLRIGIYGFAPAAHIITQVARHQQREIYAFVAPGVPSGGELRA
jgi:hypothetical protein